MKAILFHDPRRDTILISRVPARLDAGEYARRIWFGLSRSSRVMTDYFIAEGYDDAEMDRGNRGGPVPGGVHGDVF